MMRIGIVGCGNIAHTLCSTMVRLKDHMEVVAVFTRREPSSVQTVLPVRVERMEELCRLYAQTPERLMEIRSIGTKSLPVIAEVCRRYQRMGEGDGKP